MPGPVLPELFCPVQASRAGTRAAHSRCPRSWPGWRCVLGDAAPLDEPTVRVRLLTAGKLDRVAGAEGDVKRLPGRLPRLRSAAPGHAEPLFMFRESRLVSYN